MSYTYCSAVLLQVTSASSCERNWSAFGFIHTKSRNRLKPKKAEELVYVFSNRRLLARQLTDKPRFIQWAEEAEEAEEDLDGGEDCLLLEDGLEGGEAVDE